MDKYAPVCIICYNRVDKIQKTIECLAKNTLAKHTEVYIFSDAPKNTRYGDKGVESVRSYLHSLKQTNHGFKSLEIHEARENLGIRDSVIKFANYIFHEKGYDRFIGLEDDIETHQYFLQYMNDSLEFYKDNHKIMAITAFAHQNANLKSRTLRKYPHNVLFSYAFHSWGWGMWKDRWEEINWSYSDITWYTHNPKHVFYGTILSWFHLLAIRKSVVNKTKPSELWDIHLSHVMYKSGKTCVWPSQLSYTRNFGFDGSGSHKFNFDADIVNFNFGNPEEKPILTHDINLNTWFHFKIGLLYALEVWVFGFVKMFVKHIFTKISKNK